MSGVEVIRYGKKFTIHCKKEVILSAGAIGSPQILMLSGIGPEEHLKQHKVRAGSDMHLMTTSETCDNINTSYPTPIAFVTISLGKQSKNMLK